MGGAGGAVTPLPWHDGGGGDGSGEVGGRGGEVVTWPPPWHAGGGGGDVTPPMTCEGGGRWWRPPPPWHRGGGRWWRDPPHDMRGGGGRWWRPPSPWHRGGGEVVMWPPPWHARGGGGGDVPPPMTSGGGGGGEPPQPESLGTEFGALSKAIPMPHGGASSCAQAVICSILQYSTIVIHSDFCSATVGILAQYPLLVSLLQSLRLVVGLRFFQLLGFLFRHRLCNFFRRWSWARHPLGCGLAAIWARHGIRKSKYI